MVLVLGLVLIWCRVWFVWYYLGVSLVLALALWQCEVGAVVV